MQNELPVYCLWWLSNKSTTSLWLALTAKYKGDFPARSKASLSAPWYSSNETMASDPFSDAICRAVRPWPSRSLTVDPCFKRVWRTLRLPFCTQICSSGGSGDVVGEVDGANLELGRGRERGLDTVDPVLGAGEQGAAWLATREFTLGRATLVLHCTAYGFSTAPSGPGLSQLAVPGRNSMGGR